MADSKYTALYGQSFVRPKRLASYEASINIDALTAECVCAEATHKARIANHKVYVVAERNIRQFILKVVEDMRVRELRNPGTFYKMVKATDLLTHLQSIYGCLHALNVPVKQNYMQRFHLEIEVIPNYINTLNYAQKTLKRAGNTITNNTLIIIAVNAMLENGALPGANDEW